MRHTNGRNERAHAGKKRQPELAATDVDLGDLVEEWQQLTRDLTP